MSYVSWKEKVFDLPDQEECNSSVSLVKGSDHLLKIFPAVGERKSAPVDECHKYEGLVNGKEQTDKSKLAGFKFVPIDVLLTILMAEKDAYIQELLDRQERCTCGERLFKTNDFADSEDDKEALIRKDAEVLALKNRNAVIESELEECRDTLRKAMHKLEEVEGILNENEDLNDRLKFAEEMLKLAEDSKKALEIELENRGSSFDSRRDEEPSSGEDPNLLVSLYNERDGLKQQVQQLGEELSKAKASIAEMDALRQQYETILLNLEEVSRQNECCKKKMEGTKKLEIYVQDLTKQAKGLAEKYKRESNRANEQRKQISINARELQTLREEKDALQVRVMELSSLEKEYRSMKNKLCQFEMIIDENELLNSKLSSLDELKSENERLRTEVETLKLTEVELNESKKKMVQMQSELASQEEEIKELISQLNILSKEYVERKEYNCLKEEIQEKIDIIKESERQLFDLRSETEHLRGKLQKYKGDLASYEKSTKHLQEELDAYRKKFHQSKTSSQSSSAEPVFVATRFEEKVRFANELSLIQELVTETCPVVQLNNPDIEDENKMTYDGSKVEDAEKRRSENSSQTKLLEKEFNRMLEQTNKFEEILSLKDERIRALERDILELNYNLTNCGECQDLRNYSVKLESDVADLQEINQQLQNQLSFKSEEEERIEKLESSVKIQKKTLEFSKRFIREIEGKLSSEIISRKLATSLNKLLKKEALLSRKEICVSYLTEIEFLKNEIDFRKRLIDELKEENRLLRKMKTFTESTGKRALEDVLQKLKAELLILQNLSKPELEAECRALQAEVKRLVDEADNLKIALEAERKSKDQLEKELDLIQEEVSCAAKARNNNVKNTATMTSGYETQSQEIKKALDEIKVLKGENDEFVTKIEVLKNQCRDLKDEVTILRSVTIELEARVRDEKIVTNKQKEEINELNEKIKVSENEVRYLKVENEGFNQKAIALREELTAKEMELDRTKKEMTDMKNEVVKLTMEVKVLKNGPEEKDKPTMKDEEKEESEDTILKVEKEFEELRNKLESCKTPEEKLAVLRTKRDNLIVKVNCFESEVEFLKEKLFEWNLMKTELEQLKAERKTMNDYRMNMESEEKLLNDIFSLREQIKLQQKEMECARFENTSLKDKLHELGKVLDTCKLQNQIKKADIGITTSNNFDLHMSYDENTTARVDSSTSCEKLDSISIDEFKIEIARIKTRHKTKVQKLKDGNTEKIKRLKEQYEKESKNRNKAYNKSLNLIKSNYESDIRKLVEKHKASIIRLQSLHEDEVQELNTNYETQMEAMQTFNENVVNDLSSGAVEKCKLTEKYNKEIKDMESRFQKLLKEKENQHKIEIANLQENLTRSVNEQRDMHKQDIGNLSRSYKENITQLKEKHNREMEKFKNNLKRSEVMRHKYEALLTEERKKFEEQLQILLDSSRMGHQGDQTQELKFVHLTKNTPNHSPRLLEFNKILKKIIVEGLEALPFHELMTVHCKTCFAAESFFEDLNSKNLTSEGCIHTPLLREEKEELLKRIFILENEIAIKQLETHEAIINMETAEKCRMEELATLLKNEREKNSQLKKMLNSQTKAQTDLKIESYVLDRQATFHESNCMEKVKELEVERSETRRLEEELQKEKNNSKRLALMLENERQRLKSQRKKDSEYIEAMRMRLEEALSHEQIMESQLDYEAQFRTKLEFELQSLQRSFDLIRDQPSLETKTVKDIKNLDQFESEKEEKLNKKRNKVKTNKNC